MMETKFRSIKRQQKSSSNQQRDSQPAVSTSPRLPKKDVGQHHRKIVTVSTIGRSMQYFTLNLLFDMML